MNNWIYEVKLSTLNPTYWTFNWQKLKSKKKAKSLLLSEQK